MSAVKKGDINIRPMERRDIFPVLAMFKKMPDARGALTHRDLTSWSLGKERHEFMIQFLRQYQKETNTARDKQNQIPFKFTPIISEEGKDNH